MQNDYSSFQIPSFVRNESYNFESAEKQAEFPLYAELNQIAEEIDKCRLRNC